MELLDLHNLTQEERNIIMGVIRRDDDLRRRQENRISQVKQEIHGLRMSSVLRSGDDLSKMCARCKSPFGRLSNTGEVCPACHFRVCRGCRQNLLSKGWLCSLCFKENQLQWLSGEWMEKTTGRGGGPSRFSHGTDLLRASLRIKHPNGEEGQGDSDGRAAGKENGQGLTADGVEEEVITMDKLPTPSGTAAGLSADPQGMSCPPHTPCPLAQQGRDEDPGMVASQPTGLPPCDPLPACDPENEAVASKPRNLWGKLRIFRPSEAKASIRNVDKKGDKTHLENSSQPSEKKEATHPPEDDQRERGTGSVNMAENRETQATRSRPISKRGKARRKRAAPVTLSIISERSEPEVLETSNSTTAQLALAASPKYQDQDPNGPSLNQLHPQTDRERGGASDQSSDTGHASPGRGRPSAGSTPQKSALSIPSVVATSHSGSNDEGSRESLASVYSDAGEINYGRIPVSGEITFGLEFDPKLSALRIHLKGCKDLAPVNVKRNSSDPYVKVYLLPDKTRSGKQKSKIKKHTLNPVFNETLTYNISQGELENRVLWVTVWHNDRLGRNDFLGEVTIPMDTYRFGDSTPCTYTLEARTPDTVNEEAMQYKGDLVVSLKYVTPDNITETKKSKSKSKKSKSAAGSLGEIHAMIKSACNLTAARSNGASDPFVKGYLLPDRGKTSKQKTPVVKNSVNPTWSHILVFDGVDAMEVADRCLELTVWDHETLGTNQFLGGARLNLGRGSTKGVAVDWMDARGQENIAWQNMMERPNSWVDAKLPLRANMGKSKK